MDPSPSFDSLAEALVPDKTRAMILLEETVQNEGSMLLERLTSRIGNGMIFEIMNDSRPLTFLISLPAERLDEAVLWLTEQGITRLKAVQRK